MSTTPFERAVSLVGGQNEMARRLGVKQGQVWAWLRRNRGPFPAEFCIPVERATEGQVTRNELRPDIFGETSRAA